MSEPSQPEPDEEPPSAEADPESAPAMISQPELDDPLDPSTDVDEVEEGTASATDGPDN